MSGAATTSAIASSHQCNSESSIGCQKTASSLSRYESQKRRDWNTFGQYLKNHRPPLLLSRCSGAHILEFLRYLDQFGKTKVHNSSCPFFGHPHPPAPCPCPLRQAWGSLDALVGRLRAAFEENGGKPEMNPFGTRAVRLYLREVRDTQAKARGIAYEKKKRKKCEKQGVGMVMGDEHHQFDDEYCEDEDEEEDEKSSRGGLRVMMVMEGSSSSSLSPSSSAGARNSIIPPLSVIN